MLYATERNIEYLDTRCFHCAVCVQFSKSDILSYIHLLIANHQYSQASGICNVIDLTEASKESCALLLVLKCENVNIHV